MAVPAYKLPQVSASYVIAGQRCAETLLNCYCREVGMPEKATRICNLRDIGSWPVSIRLALAGKQVLEISMSRIKARIIVAVERYSDTANFIYLSSIYSKKTGESWMHQDWKGLAHLIIHDLAIKHNESFNEELLDQIEDSVSVTAEILEDDRRDTLPENPLEAYLCSEQSLIYGHPFHPAPKSRQGFSQNDLRKYSPEFGQGFPLHYFAVHENFVYQKTTIESDCAEIIAQMAPSEIRPNLPYILVPCHPWQAKWLLDNPLVRSAISQGKLKNIGSAGKHFYPTSSIRTLYQPENPYFYKFSLHVRLTNCIRKNAVYELESALQINKIMAGVMESISEKFPGVSILAEPAFLSVDLKEPDENTSREVTEGFGVILRKNFDKRHLDNGVTPLLAGALFGNHTLGCAYLRDIISALSEAEGQNSESTRIQWFSAYVQKVMYPILECYFAHGIVFEPHLQNVVIGLSDNRPTHVYLRDFEGVKLILESYPEDKLSGVSARTHESLWYSSEQGWNRICYCLFVNNFCEAIHQISLGDVHLERLLWQEVKHHLKHYQSRYGTALSEGRIDGLINGHAFPSKANLSNRFRMQADKLAGYMPLINPMGRLS